MFRFLFSSLAIVSLISCTPDTEYALSDFDPAVMDAEILGNWVHKEKDELTFIHIGKTVTDGEVRIVMIDHHASGNMDVHELRGHITHLDNQHYLNLKQTYPLSKDPGYILVQYQYNDRQIVFSLMNSEIVNKFIQDKRIRGLEYSSSHHGPYITADQKKLRAFIQKNQQQLFQEKFSIQRMIP